MMTLILKSRNERHYIGPTALPRRDRFRDHSPKGVPLKLKKSIALVTGASSGVRKATTERLAIVGYTV